MVKKMFANFQKKNHKFMIYSFFLLSLFFRFYVPRWSKKLRDIQQECEGTSLNYFKVYFNYIEQLSRSLLLYLGFLCLSWSIFDYLGLYQCISVYLCQSMSILVHLSLSWSILVYLGLSRSISVYLGLSWSILVYLGLSWAILDNMGLSGTICGYLGLS